MAQIVNILSFRKMGARVCQCEVAEELRLIISQRDAGIRCVYGMHDEGAEYSLRTMLMLCLQGLQGDQSRQA
jgi:hypothetical protein